ncbi:MAG TPA: hypothetical protein VJC00_01000 [Candidatus Nanoarchaeia archaeon]|nr:hypothetical protein [Candidatus Nanoarchaeia archaeon]
MKKEIHEPAHFSRKDFFKALFGSFVIGLTFLFKGSLVSYAIKMGWYNVILVLFTTFLVVSLEIYALSYKFVVHRKERPFYEFWSKRFFAITISTFIAIYFSIYIYGINSFLTQIEILKVTSAVFMPAAITGAAVEVLKEF